MEERFDRRLRLTEATSRSQVGIREGVWSAAMQPLSPLPLPLRAGMARTPDLPRDLRIREAIRSTGLSRYGSKPAARDFSRFRAAVAGDGTITAFAVSVHAHPGATSYPSIPEVQPSRRSRPNRSLRRVLRPHRSANLVAGRLGLSAYWLSSSCPRYEDASSAFGAAAAVALRGAGASLSLETGTHRESLPFPAPRFPFDAPSVKLDEARPVSSQSQPALGRSTMAVPE